MWGSLMTVITKSKNRPHSARCNGLQIYFLGGEGGGHSWLQIWFPFPTTASISTSKPHHMSDDHRKPGAYTGYTDYHSFSEAPVIKSLGVVGMGVES